MSYNFKQELEKIGKVNILGVQKWTTPYTIKRVSR